YYLHYALFNDVAKFFSFDEDNSLQQYYCTLAMSNAGSTNYSPFGAIVSYYLGIMATQDTIKRNGLQNVKTSGQLIVLDKFGQITYELSGKDFGMIGPVLDTISGLLLFRTYKVEKLSDIFGLEIHNLRNHTSVFDTLLNSSLFISDPKQTDRYVLFEIYQKPEIIRKKIIIVDLDKRIVRYMVLNMENIIQTVIWENNLVISREIGISSEDSENTWAYDTIQIKRIPILRSF
ncbi:MAG: hypothetical protein ABJB16_15435, partial [Saprospiraceae bacterium]